MCQKIGHLCQEEAEPKEEVPKTRRTWKKVTQTWKYKGPISQKNQQEKIDEQRQENTLSPQKNKKEEELEEEHDRKEARSANTKE